MSSSMEAIRAKLLALGGAEGSPIGEGGEAWLPMRREGDRWRAARPHLSLRELGIEVAPLVREVLELPWPERFELDGAELEGICGASEQVDLRDGEARHPLRYFACDHEGGAYYALDLLDAGMDPLALAVWRVDHDGSEAAPWSTLGELLGIS